MTAAPRMIRAKGARSASASLSTRAVIPTLVAASMAPRKAWSIHGSWGRISSPTPNPSSMGVTTPTTATSAARPPTAIISFGVDSRPTWKSSRTAPSSAMTVSVSLEASADRSGPPRSAAFPARIPTINSPSTAGWPRRSTNSPASFAQTMAKARASRTVGTASESWPAPAAANGKRAFTQSSAGERRRDLVRGDEEERSGYERGGGSCWELGVAAGDLGVERGWVVVADAQHDQANPSPRRCSGRERLTTDASWRICQAVWSFFPKIRCLSISYRQNDNALVDNR